MARWMEHSFHHDQPNQSPYPPKNYLEWNYEVPCMQELFDFALASDNLVDLTKSSTSSSKLQKIARWHYEVKNVQNWRPPFYLLALALLDTPGDDTSYPYTVQDNPVGLGTPSPQDKTCLHIQFNLVTKIEIGKTLEVRTKQSTKLTHHLIIWTIEHPIGNHTKSSNPK